jgi:hypothetical protein
MRRFLAIWSKGMFSIAKPKALCFSRNSTTMGLGFFVVCLSNDLPNVKSDIISKNRSRKALLAFIGVLDVACRESMSAVI